MCPLEPQNIGKLCRLKELLLESNSIECLPDELSSLVFLQVLNVNSNLLTLLPTSVCQLASLTKLQISDNRLTHLPSYHGNCVLSDLNEVSLAGKNLQYLPLDVVRLPMLRHLIVDDNVDLHYIPEVPDNDYFLQISKETVYV
ncbi:hypothetical protein DPMN_111017, partial [Dreissena polymorpha]